MAARLSIIICTCNRAGGLAETLRHLAAQDAGPARFEVVVVDNGSTDETPAVAAEAARAGGLPGLRHAVEPIPGQAHTRVRGVRESGGEWIAFVDDDNYLGPGWVSAALRFADAHPACGAFGGQVVIDWEIPPPPAVARRAYAYAATDLPGGTHRLDGEDRWRLRGAGLVCRRRALLETGWLEWQANVGRIGRGSLAGDDTEIVMRIARDGWQLWYEPACRLRHAIGESRISVASVRAMHRGFALADPLLLGFRDHGSPARWAGRLGLLFARRLFALARHAARSLHDADARLTARLTLDALLGNLRGLAAVARLTPDQRRAWLGNPARTVSAFHLLPSTRVLHLHSGRDYGGLERLLFCLGADRAAAPAMEPVFGLGYPHRLARELSATGARVEILGAVTRRRFWLVLAPLFRLAALLRRERFDAVVCHGSSSLAFFGWVARLSGVPLVLWMHSDTKVRNKNAVEFLAGRYRPALAFCNSAFTAASLPLLFASPPPPHVVVHCPVSPPAVPAGNASPRRQALRSEHRTPADAVVIILPSRLEEWKGHGVLLEALGRLHDQPEWVCWIAGGPFNAAEFAFLETLRHAARTLGIAERVRFLGQREDVPALLAAADVFCQPNLTPEPFGVNAVEALYAGLPVVASDSGGTREIVDATCGRLVPPADVDALTHALSTLIGDAALRAELGARAPARARAVSDPARILPVISESLAALRPAAPAARPVAVTALTNFAAKKEGGS